MKKQLEQFYQLVADDLDLTDRFELIADREELLKLVVQLGAENNYFFTMSDVEDSIEESTASGQGDYLCLPHGCWHTERSICEVNS